MDSIMALALLQRRIPDVSYKDFDNLIKDAFCARCIDSHTYEGRLFVTEKAVFFASSYSDAKVYDVHIASGAIESVTAFHRSIIPSLEFTLTSGKVSCPFYVKGGFCPRHPFVNSSTPSLSPNL